MDSLNATSHEVAQDFPGCFPSFPPLTVDHYSIFFSPFLALSDSDDEASEHDEKANALSSYGAPKENNAGTNRQFDDVADAETPFGRSSAHETNGRQGNTDVNGSIVEHTSHAERSQAVSGSAATPAQESEATRAEETVHDPTGANHTAVKTPLSLLSPGKQLPKIKFLTFTLHRDTHQPNFGFRLMTTAPDGYMHINEVLADGAADGFLLVGDELVAVKGMCQH